MHTPYLCHTGLAELVPSIDQRIALHIHSHLDHLHLNNIIIRYGLDPKRLASEIRDQLHELEAKGVIDAIYQRENIKREGFKSIISRLSQRMRSYSRKLMVRA